MRRVTIPVVTAGDQTAVVYSPRISGKVHSIHYVKDGTTPFTDGVDFTITSAATGESLWTEANVNASASRYPRAPTHSGAGVASLYAAGGTAVQAPIALGNDQVKIAIAQGGATKLGTFIVLVD